MAFDHKALEKNGDSREMKGEIRPEGPEGRPLLSKHDAPLMELFVCLFACLLCCWFACLLWFEEVMRIKGKYEEREGGQEGEGGWGAGCRAAGVPNQL